jgi:hypothetical protein
MSEDESSPDARRNPDAPAVAADGRTSDRISDTLAQSARERFGAFYLVYIGIFVLLFAYLISVRIAEAVLDANFRARIEGALIVNDLERPIEAQLKHQLDQVVQSSGWVRWGGLKVTTLVQAKDGETWLYVDGHGALTKPTEGSTPGRPTNLDAWVAYLPASANVTVTLPHNSLVSNTILIAYASILLFTIYESNRRLIRRETERLSAAARGRNQAATRAAEIETELNETRARLSQIEPLGREQTKEIDGLQRERESLQRQLEILAEREEVLRGDARQAVELSQEVRALEDLLEEATGDLDLKDGEIDRLEQNLEQVTRSSGKTRTKQSEILARRYRTLYKTIEVNERALENLANLGDDGLRLKAEECVKRLADDAKNVAVRRKVGGLPSHVQVFELGFAGKGRIYYCRGKNRRFRILLVGAKNTQSTDLEFLSRLPKEEFS